MAKRFMDLGRYRQAWRKLDAKTFRLFCYMWDQADPAGVYHVDKDQVDLDCGFAFDVVRIAELNVNGAVACRILDGCRVLLVDFIADNYGSMKAGYNPHKPAFRAIEKNNLTLNSSLNQACFKLEDEDEDENKEEGERAGDKAKPRPKKVVITLVFPAWFTEPTKALWDDWKAYRKREHGFGYKSSETEQDALNKIGREFRSHESFATACANSKPSGHMWMYAPKHAPSSAHSSPVHSAERKDLKTTFD